MKFPNPKKAPSDLVPADHAPALSCLFSQLRTEHLEELGALWRKHARFVLCADKLSVRRSRINFFLAGEKFGISISSPAIGEVTAFVRERFLYCFHQTLSAAEWNRWNKFATSYVRGRIQSGLKGRYRFQDRLFEIDTSLATMFNNQISFQVEKNYRGSYSVRLFGVPLPGAENLRQNDARYYLFNIYAEQFQFAALY